VSGAQVGEAAILGNARGSPDYEAFVDALGWQVCEGRPMMMPRVMMMVMRITMMMMMMMMIMMGGDDNHAAIGKGKRPCLSSLHQVDLQRHRGFAGRQDRSELMVSKLDPKGDSSFPRQLPSRWPNPKQSHGSSQSKSDLTVGVRPDDDARSDAFHSHCFTLAPLHCRWMARRPRTGPMTSPRWCSTW
jgi:hypothetical protein